MGWVEVSGSLELDRKRATEITAPCGGRISKILDFYDPTLRISARTRKVLEYGSQDLIDLQKRLLSRSSDTAAYNDLLALGMSHKDLAWVLEKRKLAIRRAVWAPSTDVVEFNVVSGTFFRKGQRLCQHGPLSATCHIRLEAAAHVPVGSSCIITPVDWQNDSFNGYILDVQQPLIDADFAIYRIEIKGKPRPYQPGTRVSIMVAAPTAVGCIDGNPRHTVKAHIEAVTRPTPGEERIAMRRLQQKGNKQLIFREPDKSKKPRFPLAAIPTFVPGLTPTQKPVIKEPQSPTKIVCKDKREWDLAKIQAVRVERRVLHHRYEALAECVGLGHLQNSEWRGGDQMHIAMLMDEPVQRFLYVRMPSVDFLKFGGEIKVAVHLCDRPNLEFNEFPYKSQIISAMTNMHSFYLKMPMTLQLDLGTNLLDVLLVGAEPAAEVRSVPDGCLLREGSDHDVLALTEELTLRALRVTKGRSAGGYTEIIDGLRVGDSVCFDPDDTLRRIRDARSTIASSLIAEIRIKTRAAFSGGKS